MTTKADIIRGAYTQLRISGLTVSPVPEENEVALSRLENMVAEFDVNIHYNFEDTPDINSPTNVERKYWHALQTNLAVRLIPDFNKQVPPVLAMQASQSLSNMIGASVTPRQVRYPSRQPIGSGNRWVRYIDHYPGAIEAPNNPETNRLFIGDVGDYVEHFDAYLTATETVSSYTLEVDQGLTVITGSLASPDISYRIRADNAGAFKVIIKATTSLGRIETRVIFFEVASASAT